MKKFLLGTVALVALAAPASAADLAPRPYTKAPPAPVAVVYDWTGFYIGGNGGWGTSRKRWDVFGFDDGSHDADGGTAGGQIGYRWQAGTWVFGVEGQGNWADFKGSHTSLLTGIDENESRIDAFGLLTGQVGYAWNNVLLYVKGGAAVVGDRFRVRDTFTGIPITDTVDDTRWGATVGAGIEVGFAPNWSVGAEYNHIFLGDRSYDFINNGNFAPAGTLFATENIRQDVDLVTVRLNYKWGGPLIARY
ncbi:outer membrane protein [Bradyrhizobium cenepequi]|uniref:outer membrane protein n=1 Tax=Bradyrhizobium cenepequi TaxID=2821403 RepID=UPI001CE37DD9|nr:outer membrane beta-barrel protein [Bradyrhizobium cenepequi]MCA6109008.1 porin family protein [Bradyrhizobium cenepequi]